MNGWREWSFWEAFYGLAKVKRGGQESASDGMLKGKEKGACWDYPIVRDHRLWGGAPLITKIKEFCA